MTGPDSNYPQNPQQPPWESGPPAGHYATGGQYPTGAQYPSGAQYPAPGQPIGGHPGSATPGVGQYGQFPPGHQYSATPAPNPAYAPGQGWDVAASLHDSGPGGPQPGPSGFGVHPPAGGPGAAPRRRVAPAKLFGLVIAVLGGLNFVFGFLPEVSAPRTSATLSVFAVGPAYVPILLLIAGLLALAAFLPGSERSRLAVAAVSVGGAAGAIVSLGTPGSFELFANPNQVSSGLGAILLVIFGIVQAVIAVGAYVVGADTWLRPKGPASGAPALVSANSAGSEASGSGPIDPGLVGAYSSQRPQDLGYPGRGGAAWPAGQDAAQPSWAGYPQPGPGYADLGQPVTSVSGGYPSRPVPHEEPATGPQVVLGLETGRFDKTSAGQVGGATTGDDGRQPSGDPVGEGGKTPEGTGGGDGAGNLDEGADGSAVPGPSSQPVGSIDDRAPARRQEP